MYCDGVRCSGAHRWFYRGRAVLPDINNALPSRVPLKWGHQDVLPRAFGDTIGARSLVPQLRFWLEKKPSYVDFSVGAAQLESPARDLSAHPTVSKVSTFGPGWLFAPHIGCLSPYIRWLPPLCG